MNESKVFCLSYSKDVEAMSRLEKRFCREIKQGSILDILIARRYSDRG